MHEHLVEAGQVELSGVQAGEIRVRVVGRLMGFVVMPEEIPKRRGRRPKWLVEEAVAA